MLRALYTETTLVSVEPDTMGVSEGRLTPAAFLHKRMDADAFIPLTGTAKFEKLRAEVKQLYAGE